MNKKKFRYNLINIVIISAALALFICNYRNTADVFSEAGIFRIIIISITTIMVHGIKSARIYLELYGSNRSFLTYLKTYCKVTPVSVIFPYKLGEFYRMYCYGTTLNNMLKGIIIVLMDRFVDTLALITMILLVWMISGGSLIPIVYILLLFTGFALLIYVTFPGIYIFWKRYFLKAHATERKLMALKFLVKLNAIYEEIRNVSRGRGLILYIMSLAAWGIEIGSLVVLNGAMKSDNVSATIAAYLSSAMGSGVSIELRQFVFVSVIILLLLYLVLECKKWICEKRAFK